MRALTYSFGARSLWRSQRTLAVGSLMAVPILVLGHTRPRGWALNQEEDGLLTLDLGRRLLASLD